MTQPRENPPKRSKNTMPITNFFSLVNTSDHKLNTLIEQRRFGIRMEEIKSTEQRENIRKRRERDEQLILSIQRRIDQNQDQVGGNKG